MFNRSTIETNTKRVLGVLLASIGLIVLPFATAAENASDADISAAVKTEIVMDAVVPFNNLNVETNAGIVTLTGSVESLTERERAERLATTVRGVRSVINRIEVKPPHAIDAHALQNAVERALLTDPATDSYEVDATADAAGTVTLTGNVDSWAERELAETVAGEVSGVRNVNNQVSVTFDSDRADIEVYSDIVESLKWDAHIDASSIDVTVEDGKVSLTGSVASAAERNRALRRSWVAGVKEVDVSELNTADVLRNDWKRAYEPFMASDAEIEKAVNAAMLYDPRVDSFDVVATVDNGVVTLTGVVDNLKARSAAYDNAMNTVGVLRTENHIAVETDLGLADEDIEKYAEAAIERDAFVDHNDVTVDVTAGTATMTGTVDSYFEKGQAEDVVSRVMGVEAVINNINVESTDRVYLYDPYVDNWRPHHSWYSQPTRNPAMTDEVIADAIRTQLWWSPFVDSDEVEVSVDNGVATLTGTVSDWNERRAAENNAFDGGALWVHNKLEVALSQLTQ